MAVEGPQALMVAEILRGLCIQLFHLPQKYPLPS